MVDNELDSLTRGLGRALRAHRDARGLSLGELARASGLSKTILSTIESGEGNPSVETLWRVSQALDLPLGALLEPDAGPTVRAIPARSGRELQAESGMAAWLVHAEGREHRSEVYELALPKGTDHRTGSHLAGTAEVVFCISGRLRVGPDDELTELGPGDAAWFTADGPHRYVALRDSRLVGVMLYPGAAR